MISLCQKIISSVSGQCSIIYDTQSFPEKRISVKQPSVMPWQHITSGNAEIRLSFTFINSATSSAIFELVPSRFHVVFNEAFLYKKIRPSEHRTYPEGSRPQFPPLTTAKSTSGDAEKTYRQ